MSNNKRANKQARKKNRTREEKMKNLPNLRQNRMKLKTLSLANQVVGWTLKRQGNSLSGTSKVGGRCLVLPSAMRSSKSKHFCRTILACWKRENKIINSWTRMKKHPATFCYVHMRKNKWFLHTGPISYKWIFKMFQKSNIDSSVTETSSIQLVPKND